MGFIQALTNSATGAIFDQFKELVTSPPMNERTIASAGILKTSNNGRGGNNLGSENLLTNGSKIFVPENTAAIIFNQAGIENVILQPGAYQFSEGEDTMFSGSSIGTTLVNQFRERFTFGGISPNEHRVLFVNLREIRGIKFGTRGPQVYNDAYYGVDLEVFAYGSFSLQVTDPVLCVQNFLPANVRRYSVDDSRARSQIVSEFIQSLMVAINQLSSHVRVSQLEAQATQISELIRADSKNAGRWHERFGLQVISVAIENFELSESSKALVQEFAAKRMDIRAFEEVSQAASNIAAQQRIARGVENHGMGDMGGMVFGMNFAQDLGLHAQSRSGKLAQAEDAPSGNLDSQVEALKKLKDLLDAGILTEAEFQAKKIQILGI